MPMTGLRGSARPVAGLSLGLALMLLMTAAPRAAEEDADLHRSVDLRQLMRRMDTLIYDRNQSELELDKERLNRARELADIAAQVAASAPELRPAAARDEAGAREFNLYAQRLAGEARRLGEIADQRLYAELAPQIERLGHQCAACHVRFRKPPP